MRTYALRLQPGVDLKDSLISFVKDENIQAGFIISCVGSLSCAKLRMADENIIKGFDRRFEIISLSGTLYEDGVHLHIALSDENGNMVGGHLLDECLIYTTAEIIIGVMKDKVFKRKLDTQSGFCELEISEDIAKS